MPTHASFPPPAGAGFAPRAASFAALGLILIGVSCVELSPVPARSDVDGCYDLSIPGSEEAPASSPPGSVALSDDPYLPSGASRAELARHRFDASAAREAFFVYADTAYRVAWWWADERERRLGVGNLNTAAAFYIDAVVRGDRFEGELRRWRFDRATTARPS